MTLIAGTLKNYPNNVLIETGTYHGDGIQAAIDAGGFDQIVSIEVSKQLADRAKERFADHILNIHLGKKPYVNIIHGDSTVQLDWFLDRLHAQATFVLDSHFLTWADDTTGKQGELAEHPLVQELKLLASHPIKTHTIIIDDVRLFGMFGTDIESVKKLILEINPDYEVSFIDGLIENDVVNPNEVMIAEVKK